MKKLEIKFNPEYMYGGGLDPIVKKGSKLGLKKVTPTPYFDPNVPQLVSPHPFGSTPESTPPEFITKVNAGAIIEKNSIGTKKVGTVDVIFKLIKTKNESYVDL